MDEKEKRRVYGIVSKLWADAKKCNTDACFAIEMAGMIYKFIQSPNVSEVWDQFVKDTGTLSERYQSDRQELVFDWLTHDVSRAIEGRCVKG